ncbi:MAG: glutamyl-tRNA reductase [Actinomycetota bacterium]
MSILALGVSYRRASVDLLERLAFSPHDDAKAYRALMESPPVTEAVILSTCNRVEVYAEVESYHAGFQELKLFLAESREVSPEEFAEPLYSHYESQAPEHLFSVAAGIDSLIVGEPQILGQVRQAFRRAHAEHATGPTLGRLFRDAARAGKRARAETAIGSSPAAFVEAGVALAERTIGPVSGRPAVVVGAGAMASLAVSHLRERDMGPIRIVNRSPERAGRLAARVGADTVPFDRLAAALGEADLVVSSTGATAALVGPDVVQEALRLRRPNARPPLFFVDLAVPRDVDPSVRDLPGAAVADLDDIRRFLEERQAGHDGHLGEVERVRAIVSEEVERFESWRRSTRLAPLIQALRERGDRIQAAELARFAPRLAGLSSSEREAVESLVRAVIAKLLHDPIVRLKDVGPSTPPDGHARAFAEVFGLSWPAEDRRT